MKFHTTPRVKWLFVLLPALLAGPAAADDHFAVFSPALGMVAQLSPEERRAMRERWEQAGPEERLRMRRDYQERQRDRREANHQRNENADQGGFGVGFEYRRRESGAGDAQAVPPGDFPNPGDFYDRGRNRGGRRQ